jgi:transposase
MGGESFFLEGRIRSVSQVVKQLGEMSELSTTVNRCTRQGMSLRKIAELLETSYQSISRIAKKEGLLLQHGKKLKSEQQEEALELLRADVPFREVAQRFGVNHETLRQLALREGVALRPKGQKLTPTQRRLTPVQIQEVRDLLGSGQSLRRVASHLGIGRQTLKRLLKRDERR